MIILQPSCNARPPTFMAETGEFRLEEFLESRNIDKRWWRCSRCLQRVKTDDHGFQCPTCKAQCEPERVAWRQKRFPDTNAGPASYATIPTSTSLAYSDSQAYSDSNAGQDYVGCGQCQNTWLPDDSDPTGQAWLPCPICQPGATEAVLY
jgi:hypothetical protein